MNLEDGNLLVAEITDLAEGFLGVVVRGLRWGVGVVVRGLRWGVGVGVKDLQLGGHCLSLEGVVVNLRFLVAVCLKSVNLRALHFLKAPHGLPLLLEAVPSLLEVYLDHCSRSSVDN